MSRLKRGPMNGDRENRGGREDCGFSLVEVCLALLVVTLGLTAVFGLFPSGLQSSETGTVDTRMALLAEQALGGMRARADEISSWGTWQNIGSFRTAVADSGLGVAHTPGVDGVRLNHDGAEFLYRLAIEEGPQPEIRKAVLDLWPYRGSVKTNEYSTPSRFYTEFFYMSMP